MVIRVLTILCLLGGVAHAKFTEEERNVLSTAEVLRGGEFRIGLLRWDYGLSDRWQIGTYPIFYATALVPELGPLVNGNLKVRLYSSDSKGWTVSSTGSLFAAPSAQDGDFQVLVLFLHSTWHWKTISLTTSGGVSKISGQVPEFDGTQIAADAAFGQFQTLLEWRRSDTFAWILEGRWSVTDSVAGNSETELTANGGRTRVTFYAGADASGFDARRQLIASAMWSWDMWNLKVGLSRGDLYIPGAQILVSSQDGPVILPNFDLYLRF